MVPYHSGSFAGTLLRVHLSEGKISKEIIDENTLRKYLGGTGIGIFYLYKEVLPAVQWNNPENRIILASGPLGGTKVGGSGTISIVTKGCLTNGATSVQANGYFGAFLRRSGFYGIILQGASDKLVYLYIHDGIAELRDATHLAGKDTWETEGLIKRELGKTERGCSVLVIGPGGENLVKFACIMGDKGHAAAHNGVGAVMGSKRLKAIVVDRGTKGVEVADSEKLSSLAKKLFEGQGVSGGYTAKFGTAGDVARCQGRLNTGMIPVKNYTTNIFPEYINFGWERFGSFFDIKRNSCWACRFEHCHLLTVKEGRYAGYVGEEPEYEQFVHWGPLIGQSDAVEAFVLSNEVDRLGIDTNETGWTICWLMECYEKGLITKEDTDGIEMRWGDIEAVKAMLLKIAHRQGIGDILAEGLLRSSEKFGPEARSLAVYTQKGNTPRGHDHRNYPQMMLDTCVSDTGTDEAGTLLPNLEALGLPAGSDVFSPETTSKVIASTISRMPLDDCLGMCRFNNRGASLGFMADLIKASTGWDYTAEEAHNVGFLVVNLLRVFNLRHGITADLDAPSPRYSSSPTDGPHQGKAMQPVWREMVQNYYRLMGWDIETSRPLPETLRKLGLEYVVKDIW